MKIRLSDFVARYFKKKGIENIFGITGGGAMYLNDSFHKYYNSKFIFFHHEQSLSMAGDSYYRVKKKPVIVHTTSGPGGSNAITGVLGAWIDSIPMIVISGQVESSTLIKKTGLRQIGIQEANIIDTVKSITKFSITVNKPEKIFNILDKAYDLATKGKPGPVWIDIPLDIQSKFIKIRKNTFNKKKVFKNIKLPKKLFTLLNSAKKPIAIIGNGIHISNAENALKKFIKKTNIPVVSSWNASDIIDFDDKNYVGRAGIFGDRASNLAVQNSDLLLVIGSRLSIPQTGYKIKEFSPKSKKIIVDIDKNELRQKKLLNIQLKICSDAKFFLDRINTKKIKKHKTKWQSIVLDWKQKYQVYKEHLNKKGKYINSFMFLEFMNNNFGKNSTIVTDMGTSFTCTMQSFKKKFKDQRLLTSSGLAAMGFGLPGAIGAYFADKRKKIFCITGDGGLMFNLQELQTVKHYKIPMKIFVYENKGYLTMKLMQKKNFGRIVGADPKSGVSIPNLKKIANAFGLKYLNINKNNIFKLLKKINNDNESYLVEVNIDPYQDLTPRLQNKIDQNGNFIVPRFDDMYPFLKKKELEKEIKKTLF